MKRTVSHGVRPGPRGTLRRAPGAGDRAAARVSTDPRFTRRRRAVERSKRRRNLVRFSLAATGLFAAWAAFFSPLLAVDDVRIVGARHTTAAEAAAVAEIDGEDNLLLVSTSEVAAKVRTLPWVKAARVDRMLPGTVRIRVEERRPAMVLSLGAAKWTIDRRGRVLTAGEAARGLPVLAGVQVSTVRPGLSLRTGEARAALSAWRSLPPALEDQVVAIFAPTIERLTFSLAAGTQVRYGAAEHMRAKNEVVRVLLARTQSEGEPAAYIDVRVPSNPALAGEPPAADRADSEGRGRRRTSEG
jgi:cell division protein FtsQ